MYKRQGFESRREQHDAEEAMPEAFTALSMSLASGHSLAQGMRFVGAHAQEPVHTEFLRVAAAIDCGISATDALDDLLVRKMCIRDRVRGAECCDMLQAMNTGHDGSLTTLHAGSEQETVVRLTLLRCV